MKTNMARLRGRAPKGERLAAAIPHGHWKSRTFIAGMRSDRIEAPWVLDGAMNGEAFRTYLREVLAPTLSEGDIVVMDNLSAHKVKGVREIIEATGARTLYLPPPDQVRGRLYSPDLNPIEQMFAKLKAMLRKAAERSVEGIFKAIGNIIDTIDPDECRNYLRNSGYAST